MNKKEFIENLQLIKNDTAKMAFLRRIFITNSSDQTRGLALLAKMGVKVSDIKSAIPYMATAYVFSVLKGEEGCSFPIALKKATVNVVAEENPFNVRFDRMLSCSNVENLVKQHIINVVNILKTNNVGVDYYLLLEDLIKWKKIKNEWIEKYYC